MRMDSKHVWGLVNHPISNQRRGLHVRWCAGGTLDMISSLKPLVKVEALALIKPLSPPTCGIWCALLTVRNNRLKYNISLQRKMESRMFGGGAGIFSHNGEHRKECVMVLHYSRQWKNEKKKDTCINVSVQFVLVSRECWISRMFRSIFQPTSFS